MATVSIDQSICPAEADNPKSLLRLQDDLNEAMELAEAAFMAACSVGDNEGNALSRVIMVMQQKLEEVSDGLEAISRREKAA